VDLVLEVVRLVDHDHPVLINIVGLEEAPVHKSIIVLLPQDLQVGERALAQVANYGVPSTVKCEDSELGFFTRVISLNRVSNEHDNGTDLQPARILEWVVEGAVGDAAEPVEVAEQPFQADQHQIGQTAHSHHRTEFKRILSRFASLGFTANEFEGGGRSEKQGTLCVAKPSVLLLVEHEIFLQRFPLSFGV